MLDKNWPHTVWNGSHKNTCLLIDILSNQHSSVLVDFCNKAHPVLALPRPREESIEQLRDWTGLRFPEHHRMFAGLDRDHFRILGPKRRVVEEFVKTSVPLSAIGKYICVSPRP